MAYDEYGATTRRRSEPTVEYLMARRDLLDATIERKILERERFGVNEDYPNGSVLMWEISFGGPVNYTYVAIKVNARWYTSAKVNTDKVLTWEQLVDRFLSKADYVGYVTQYEEL